MSGLFFLLVIGFIVAAIFIAVFSAIGAKRRIEMLSAWARARGWHFTEGEVSTLEDRWPQFEQLQQGDNRYGFNVMRGRQDHRDAFAFDYHYETTSTDSKGRRSTTHHYFSAVVVDSGLELTKLLVRPEGIFDKMKGMFGVNDIDFESAEFSRAFWVRSPVKRWAYDVLHQETMEYLLGSSRLPIEFEDGPYVIVWGSHKWRPEQFEDALRYAAGILDRIPKDIRKELRNRDDYPPPL